MVAIIFLEIIILILSLIALEAVSEQDKLVEHIKSLEKEEERLLQMLTAGGWEELSVCLTDDCIYIPNIEEADDGRN